MLYRSGVLKSNKLTEKLIEFKTKVALLVKNYLRLLYDASIQILDAEVTKKIEMIRELSFIDEENKLVVTVCATFDYFRPRHTPV